MSTPVYSSAASDGYKGQGWLSRTRAGETVPWKDLDFDLAALDWVLLDDDGNELPPPDLGVTEEDAESVPTGPPADGDLPGVE